MRIRKNRTSSRVTPEFCLAHGISFEMVTNFSHLDPAESNSPQQLESSTGIAKPPTDACELSQSVTTIIHSSLEKDCTSVKIRDFVSDQRARTRSAGCKNHHYPSESTPQSTGSDSDPGLATDSMERATSQHTDEKPPTSFSDKVKSDARSKPTGKRSSRKSEQEVPVESGIARNSLPKLTTMAVRGTNHNKDETGSRKRRRRSKRDPDPSMDEKNGTGKSARSVREPATAADMELLSGTTEEKLSDPDDEEQQRSERSGNSPGSACFPAGWSYRGLAQIAEQDKPPQGKQCSRTDGRSWRCPLKVQEGFTLCEHHLSKFRSKKLSKENKRQKISNRRRRQLKRDKHAQPQFEQETPSSAFDEKEIVETLQTLSTTEHDIPMRFRRKHRTVKLSVL
ncbi:hypothetical protein R1flu_011913 [Riccia fluitans]|uniref:WRC domain-containing protein n=1 Tax=Riccia fluitans TaxID=41844 RepID=A0ABD1Z9I0_9MARC